MNDEKSLPEIAVPEKKDWPRTEHGTIDREAAFEAPESGLIPLVEQTATSDGILASCKVIIHALFSRQDDAEQRVAYERKINDAMILSFDGPTNTGNGDDDATRCAQVISVLREIKDTRIERANFHVTRKKMSVSDPVEKRQENEVPPSNTSKTGAADISAEDAFVEAISKLLAGRLGALRDNVKPGSIAGHAPPFPVSADFAKRFDTLVRKHFGPAMMDACRPFILQAENKPPPERVAFILENMEERRSREILWDSWRIIWEQLTNEQELPKKPEEQKKGLLDRLKKKKQQPSWMEEPLTLEEWEDEVRRIKKANALAIKIWAKLTEPDDAFRAPDEGDRKMLMNLFARTAAAMTRQINAIRQIAEQGGNTDKVFADYQQGKDIDLPLLCACCQNTKVFLKNGLLKNLMRSFPESMQRERFRLTHRFFGDFI
jgi:hypothetical protein